MRRVLMCLVFVCGLGAAQASADIQADWEAAVKAAKPLHWYKFDEATGGDCLDSGTGGLNGKYTGVSSAQQGLFGSTSAALFARTSGSNIGFAGAANLTGQWTAEYVVKTTKAPAGSDSQALHDSDTTSIRLAGWTALGEVGFTYYGVADYQFTPSTGWTLARLVVPQDEWVHLVFRNNGSGTQVFYNGELGGTSSSSVDLPRLRIGAHGAGPADMLQGVLEDVVVYNRALPDKDIVAHARAVGLAPVKARSPSPANGTIGVLQPLMTWTSGMSAQFHDVYFGTTPDLGQADFKGRQNVMMAMYWYFAGLQPGTTYYWRIDEVEADGVTKYTGDVWSFSAAPATAYSPTPLNGNKWIDPNTDLSWMAGMNSMKHEVYFGTDEAAVTARDAGTHKSSLAATTLDVGTLQANTTYYWVVDEVGLATTVPGEVWHFTTAGGPGGVKGEYFTNTNRNVPAAPTLTRIDPSINFNWVNDGPDASIGVDHFSVRWTADLEIAIADTYTFITSTDDGSRVWLNDQLIVDQWVDQGPTDAPSKGIPLQPGIYPFRMEYYEWEGGAVAQLFWQTPNMARQIIPTGALQPPYRARALYPRDGDVNVPQDVTLTWSAGDIAASHNIYFGDDKAAVAAATPDDTVIFRSKLAADQTSWSPGDLEWNKTYYWRIDEVNQASPDSPWASSVWSFTTADFIVVDDFETYTNDVGSRIFQTWIDGWGYTEPAPGDPGNGTGATVGHDIWSTGTTYTSIIETSIVRPGGRQSMPLDYNNAISPYYSETERTWTSPRNWTADGVTALSLQVHGYPVSFLETSPGNITMSGCGADIYNTTDEFRYAYKKLNGDGSLTVRVESVVNTAAWAKAGVIIRAGLEPAAQQVHMIITPASLVEFMYRKDAGLTTVQFATASGTNMLPHWIRLTRKGNTFTGEYSADGKTWSKITATDGTVQSTADVPMIGDVYIGLAVTSTNRNAINTAVFSNVQVVGASGAWSIAGIGYTQPGNDPATFYVAIQDSAGKTAVVSYPDTSLVLNNQWLEWKIPLSQFTGVNLKSVKTMYIGVGDRKSPSADGTGSLFIDDIRLVK